MDIWKHGTYVDTWSIVHFLSGFLLAGFSYQFGLSFLLASLFGVGILLLWEVFEWLIKIIEPSVNVFTDIIIGIIGFGIGGFVFYVEAGNTQAFFYGSLGLTILLSLWGFLDFYRKGYR